MADNISKKCTKCGKSKKIVKNFYMNRQHVAGNMADNWCRNCVNEYISDKETLLTYCSENLRKFSEELWTYANQTAVQKLVSDENYVKADTKTKQELVAKKTIALYIQQQSQTQYYQYIPKEIDDNNISDDEISSDDKLDNTKKERLHSVRWRGNYTAEELEYLEDYFAKLQRDFKIDNINHEDYAIKAAKSSLMADKSYEAWISHKGTEKAYREAQAAFDTICQSAKFSEKTRSYNDNNGMGSLGEIIRRLETDGFMQKKIEFEKDDVDSIIDDFRWILASIGVDNSGEEK